MGSDLRQRAERTGLAMMAAAGILVTVADTLGWLDKVAPGGVTKLTLLILSVVTGTVLLEIGRLGLLDNVHSQLSKLDMEAIAQRLKRDHYSGVVRVHDRFPEELFTRYVETAAREVVILQTWIPNLHEFKHALKKAIVDRQVQVRILLLLPSSQVAGFRDEALAAAEGRPPEADVNLDVQHCLAGLAALYGSVRPEHRARLQVKVYNSLPSIAVYKADEHYLVSSFLHGRLAIQCTQTEIDGDDTVMGSEVQEELNTLWRIGAAIDLGDWQGSLSTIVM
ncbi:hypothetical protein ACGFYU_31590 [Streptomyces sp. NPDC048337]|uniref:hypothetical protein n=1 Tax=Streptomyces sp. NPDC048337 TaxID=3365535 RepID=UPI003721AE23